MISNSSTASFAFMTEFSRTVSKMKNILRYSAGSIEYTVSNSQLSSFNFNHHRLSFGNPYFVLYIGALKFLNYTFFNQFSRFM